MTVGKSPNTVFMTSIKVWLAKLVFAAIYNFLQEVLHFLWTRGLSNELLTFGWGHHSVWPPLHVNRLRQEASCHVSFIKTVQVFVSCSFLVWQFCISANIYHIWCIQSTSRKYKTFKLRETSSLSFAVKNTNNLVPILSNKRRWKTVIFSCLLGAAQHFTNFVKHKKSPLCSGRKNWYAELVLEVILQPSSRRHVMKYLSQGQDLSSLSAVLTTGARALPPQHPTQLYFHDNGYLIVRLSSKIRYKILPCEC